VAVQLAEPHPDPRVLWFPHQAFATLSYWLINSTFCCGWEMPSAALCSDPYEVRCARGNKHAQMDMPERLQGQVTPAVRVQKSDDDNIALADQDRSFLRSSRLGICLYWLVIRPESWAHVWRSWLHDSRFC